MLRGAILLSLALVGLAAPAPAIDVVTCGQTYSGAGHLVADLDCSAESLYAVEIDGGGSLDLQGHTITAQAGVRCFGENLPSPCKIFSSLPGGTLQGAPPTGLVGAGVSSFSRATITGVTITGFSGHGVEQGVGKGGVSLESSTVTGNGGSGVRHHGGGKIRVRSTTISGNADWGLFAGRVKVHDSTISGNGRDGIDASRSTVQSSTVADNLEVGIDSFTKLKVKDTVVSGNAVDGVASSRMTLVRVEVSSSGGTGVVFRDRATLKDCSVRDNGVDGISRQLFVDPVRARLRVVGSEVTGNGRFGITEDPVLDPEAPLRVSAAKAEITDNDNAEGCGLSQACADFGLHMAPSIAPTTTCGTSYVLGSGIPGSSWGVCALD